MSEVPTAHSDLEQCGAEQGEAAALIVGRRSIVLPNSWTWLQWRAVSAAVVLMVCAGIALHGGVLGGGRGERKAASDQKGVRLPGVQEEVLVSSPRIAHRGDDDNGDDDDVDNDAPPCHTAVLGEECYSKVMWALEVGIFKTHPEWYQKKKKAAAAAAAAAALLNSTSSSSNNVTFFQVQSALHELSAAADCPKPCPGGFTAVIRSPTPKVPGSEQQKEKKEEEDEEEKILQSSSKGRTGGNLSCNPSACDWGVTCKNAAAICCEEDDWECCAEEDHHDSRYKNRMYCPLKGHYKVMCWNGECADSEEVCGSEERGGVKFGPESCDVQARRMRYVGCYVGELLDGELQSSPLWCSSAEECQCGAEYPFVAFFNGNTQHHPRMAQWSCLSKLPTTSFDACTSYGAWEVGAPGTYVSVYWNPMSRTKRLEAQPIDMTQTNAGGAEVLPACHTAVRGEDCFNFILWSISIGIHDHPTWYDGKITSESSFEDIQAAVALQKTSKCGQPCPVDLMRRMRNQDPGPLADTARRAAWKQRLSAVSSSGMCHSTVPGERCYNVVTWAMQTRIYKHPNWEGSGLSESSSMQEVQDILHMDEGAGCPRACSRSHSHSQSLRQGAEAGGDGFSEGHAEGSSLPWPSEQRSSSSSSPLQGPACNPTMCARGLTCHAGGNNDNNSSNGSISSFAASGSGSASGSCCAEGDWGCCGGGQGKYRNRKYCPSRGGYTVMCKNGECADSLEECDQRGGVRYGAELCPAPPHYVGCFVESGSGTLQTSPLWCSSMEDCHCPAEYPFLGFSNGKTLHYADQAQCSCYSELPSRSWSGCASYGRWEVGAPGPYVSIYRNPLHHHQHHDNGDGDGAEAAAAEGPSSSASEFAEPRPLHSRSSPLSLSPALSTPWPCHTAVRGDACFSAVLWLLATGPSENNPDAPWMELNLRANSTFEEVQLALHRLNRSAACPLPCVIASPPQVVEISTSAAPGMRLGLDANREAEEMDQLRSNALVAESKDG